MRCACLLLVVGFGAVAQAAEHPSWDSLAKLFDKPKDAPEVVALVRERELSEITKGPSGSISSRDQSYSLLYRQNKINTIVVRVAPWREKFSEPHWQVFSGKLPGDLSVDDGRDEVIKKLGMPLESRKNTWKQNGLHIWVHFNQKQDGISELFVSPGVIEAE